MMISVGLASVRPNQEYRLVTERVELLCKIPDSVPVVYDVGEVINKYNVPQEESKFFDF